MRQWTIKCVPPPVYMHVVCLPDLSSRNITLNIIIITLTLTFDHSGVSGTKKVKLNLKCRMEIIN